jgi:hypothetical protein
MVHVPPLDDYLASDSAAVDVLDQHFLRAMADAEERSLYSVEEHIHAMAGVGPGGGLDGNGWFPAVEDWDEEWEEDDF